MIVPPSNCRLGIRLVFNVSVAPLTWYVPAPVRKYGGVIVNEPP